jgi:REP element-mobilizing transposase RayT
MPPEPLAYFITFTCYGTWLQGDERGSVDREHNQYGAPLLEPNQGLNNGRRSAMADSPYIMDDGHRRIALRAICTLAAKKSWQLLAVHVRTNHIHIIVESDQPIERVMNDCKAAVSRALNKQFPDEHNRKRWTRHGSTRYLWTIEQLEEKIDYVLNRQGEPMERYPESQIEQSRLLRCAPCAALNSSD